MWYRLPHRGRRHKPMKQLIFAALVAIAFGVFIWTIQRYIKVMTRGTADPRPRFDQIPRRLAMVLIYFIGQKKVAERQIAPSPPSYHHLFIFWGFLIITVGTIELLINGIVPGFRLSLLLGGT